MAEMDLCNQRIMQQDAEMKILKDRLRKFGIDDGAGIHRFQSLGSNSATLENAAEDQLQYNVMGNTQPDKFQSMKSGLHVRSTLMKMQQDEEKNQG